MKVTNIQINHMTEPIGFNLSDLRVEFALAGTTKTDLKKQVVITAAGETVYDSGLIAYDNNFF